MMYILHLILLLIWLSTFSSFLYIFLKKKKKKKKKKKVIIISFKIDDACIIINFTYFFR